MKSLPEITHGNAQVVVSAKKLINRYGPSLIGQRVYTQAMGEYPGGIATVTEIEPDPNAPEIVFQVEHPTFGSIGVFEYEKVALVVTGDSNESK